VQLRLEAARGRGDFVSEATPNRTPVRAGAPRPGRACALVVATLLLAACGPGDDGEDGVSAIFRLDPPNPSVGTAQLEVRLVDGAGEPLVGAEVAVEANMNHAGMKPTFADLAESESRPGLYVGDVEFTMGGDWFLLMEAEMPDGRVVERKLDLSGVRSG